MRGWKRDNGREKHGSGAYSAALFGMTEDAQRETFADYHRQFGGYIRG